MIIQFKASSLVLLFLAMFIGDEVIVAQHCPPITESYLSSNRVTRAMSGLKFELAYSKTGRLKKSYQVYLLAYSADNAKLVESQTPQKAIENSLATIVHTQIAPRVEATGEREDNHPNAIAHYEIEFNLKTKSLVKEMLKAKQISFKTTPANQKFFNSDICLAVFIPFLEDKKYSVLGGLPEHKHECNYFGESALLFQPLSQKLTIASTVLKTPKIADGNIFINLNGNRGRKILATKKERLRQGTSDQNLPVKKRPIK